MSEHNYGVEQSGKLVTIYSVNLRNKGGYPLNKIIDIKLNNVAADECIQALFDKMHISGGVLIADGLPRKKFDINFINITFRDALNKLVSDGRISSWTANTIDNKAIKSKLIILLN